MEDSDPSGGRKEVRGVEANHALKLSSNLAKRPKMDDHKAAMLGKKRARQTVTIDVEDARKAGTAQVSTPRFVREQRQSEMAASAEPSDSADRRGRNAEPNGDVEFGYQGWSNKINAEEPPADGYRQSVPRQDSLREPMDSRQFRGRSASSQGAVVAGHNAAKQRPANRRSRKTSANNNAQYGDTSIQRLIQEVTSDKFWHNPDEAELQCVPGSFESDEEYIRVFEPLLFEECRAQLYSSYEETLDALSREAHVMVRVKAVDRRERGWYDVVVLPTHEYRWTFKEGEVAVLSFPRPGSAAQSGRSKRKTFGSNEDVESKSGRLVGTVRRHMPIDKRDPIGAIIHFYIGSSHDSSSHIA